MNTFTRIAGATLVATAMFALAGCAHDKPKYAKDGLDAAQTKMAVLKSGAQWGMAEQHFFAGDLDKALKAVDQSLALNPEVAKSHLLRGRIMLEKGRLDDARVAFAHAEQLQPDNVDVQYFQGILAERTQKPDEALTRYLKAADLDANNAQYVVAAAEMHMQAGRLDDAEKLLTDRRKQFDNSPAVRQTFGHIAMLRGDSNKAAQYFNDAFLLAPKDMRILEALVEAQVASGQYADAEYNIQRLLDDEANKDRRDLKVMQARCLVAVNRPVEARSILQVLANDRAGGRDVRVWNDLGQVAAILKDRVNLRLAANRVMALTPEQPEGYVLKAMSLRLEGKNDEALVNLDAALAKAPSDPTSYVLRSVILKDLGRMTEAKSALATAQQLDPGNPATTALMNSFTSGSNTTITSHPDASN